MKVLHVITRLILGGAQENTLYTVEGHDAYPDCQVALATGPALGPEGELVCRARKNGVDLVLVSPLRREIHPLRDLASFFRIFSLCRKMRPDVVHTHSSKAGVLGRLAAWAAGVPVIVHTIHGLPFHPYQRRPVYWLYVACERLAARVSSSILTVSDHMGDRAAAAGVGPRELFETVYSGMEVEPFLADRAAEVAALRKAYGISPDDHVLGVVARLFHLKGHRFVFPAFAALARDDPSVKLMLVGDGILRDRFAAEVDALGLADRVVFCGLVDPSAIPAHVQLMDVVVHPSLREGLARVLPQGILAGKPVVSFDLDSADEVVLPGKTGFLVPPEDTGALTRAMRAALDSDLPDWTAEERERFVDRFRVRTMVAAIDGVYRRLLNSHR